MRMTVKSARTITNRKSSRRIFKRTTVIEVTNSNEAVFPSLAGVLYTSH
jgi:hypothetical protein